MFRFMESETSQLTAKEHTHTHIYIYITKLVVEDAMRRINKFSAGKLRLTGDERL
jgi:hypothetical protein